ncbi:insulinase family protein [Vibrio algivorus]|uniref:Protease 3 n=1 Tax=Vibrio algivorus TaxID=1667024 RepID=A0A557PAY0_9VIBR|nr:insulinase family protein [Vibrio algivorus]TVO37812.1 insulinase family protein [Vibrio algivorus]
MHISPNDQKQYRHITLNNQLRVLLVHDQHAQKSAAALAVNVGHFDDPYHREGLAHYLEHMLFLGTEKYPAIGEFQSFISQNGGKNNAWTGTEHTCFFFDVVSEAYPEALDRFSQFFIAPLFNQEALEKERQAVESEFRLKLKDDMRRLYQVHKEVVNPEHPFAKFSVGNVETLSDLFDENGEPTTSIRDEIIEFYRQQYSADLMTITLVGPHSLAQLEEAAHNYFTPIINNQRSGKSINIPLVREQDAAKFVCVEPEKDSRKLMMTFNFPSMDKFYQSKPLSYFAHLLGDESEGSLLQHLKTKELITSLTAGGGISGSNFREFSISCSLTKQGLSEIEYIVQRIFEFIELIRQQGLAEWRYCEKQAVLESAFRFQEASRPIDIASHLVVNLQNYQPDDVIYGDYMMSHYDEGHLRQLLRHFTPYNMRVMLIAKGLQYDRQAKWYNTPYSIRSITQQELEAWTQPESTGELKLPEPNPYICYELDPAPLESESTLPELIEDKPGFRLWHLQEPEFRVPKGLAFIAIDSPHAVSTARTIVKTRLCVEMFLDSLSKETYQAEIAGMGYNLYAHQGGVTLMLSGFTQKQAQLLDVIIERFASREFSQSRFDSIKRQMLRNWKNTAKDRPVSQLFNAMTGILQPNNPPYPVLIEALESIEVDELPSFVSAMLAELHIEMFVYGDWTRQAATNLATSLKLALRVKDQQYEESLRPLVMLGDSGTFQREIHCDQADSALVVYYQSPEISPENVALYTLANHLMSAGFFHEIRTKQQLGYMVGTGNMPLNRHPGLALYVQSPNAAPSELVASVDEFLNAFYMVLLELNEQQWQSSKQGLLNQIMSPDSNLRARGQRLWVAIGNKDYEFNNREMVVEEILKLDRSEMIRFVVNTLKPRTANRLIMHSKGTEHADAPDLDAGLEIGSIDEFQLRPKDVDLG